MRGGDSRHTFIRAIEDGLINPRRMLSVGIRGPLNTPSDLDYGKAHGVLTIDTACSAIVSLLSWCQTNEEELGDLAMEVIEQITDEERAHSPAVMASIGSVFCSGTRSPY